SEVRRLLGRTHPRRAYHSKSYIVEQLDRRLLLSSVSAAASGSAAVALTITPDATATAMQVYRSLDSSNYDQIYTGDAITSFQDTDLSPDTTYYYVVTDSDANGSYNSTANTTTAPAVPGVSALTNGSNAVSLVLSPDSTATQLQIARFDGTNTTNIYSGGMISSYPDSGLSADTTYSYTVTESNTNGVSDPGSASAVTAPTTPVASIGAVYTAEVDLNLATDPTATEMQVYRSTDNSNFSQIFTGAVSGVYQDSGLSADTRYYYQITES